MRCFMGFVQVENREKYGLHFTGASHFTILTSVFVYCFTLNSLPLFCLADSAQ